MSNRDRVHLGRAIRVASTSTQRNMHGAVVVKSGRVIGVGVNTFRNHPNSVSHPDCESAYHAEINAIRGLDVRGATIYVARITKLGEIKMSKPCASCQKALTAAGIKRMVWTEYA